MRAAVGLLEPADPLLVGAGERALLVAEQLRLQQVLLQRRAVHLDEMRPARERVVVNRAGHQFLARAGLAADQDGRVALGDLADDAEHLLQGPGAADDRVEVVDVVLRVAQVLELVAHPARLERLLDLHLHLLDFERLLHVVEGADLHGLDRRADRPERRHQDDRRRRVQRLGGPQHVEAVAAAHLQVAQHDVERPLVQPLDGEVAVRRLVDLVPGLGQRARERPPQRVVIIGNQNPAHAYPSIQNRQLSRRTLDGQGHGERRAVPARVVTSMRPSCASTILRTMARPRPEPCGLVVKNGLNTDR